MRCAAGCACAAQKGVGVSATFEKSFDQLEVGERFTTESRTIGEADIMGFAALTGDEHPQHTDADWAETSRFGERSPTGCWCSPAPPAWCPSTPIEWWRCARSATRCSRRRSRSATACTWRARSIKTRELDDEHGLVECRWKVLNQHGKTVLRVSVEVVWRAEPVLI